MLEDAQPLSAAEKSRLESFRSGIAPQDFGEAKSLLRRAMVIEVDCLLGQDPAKPLPSQRLAEKFHSSRATILALANARRGKKFAGAQVKRGGTRVEFPPEIKQIIKRHVSAAISGSKQVNQTAIIMETIRRHGVRISPSGILSCARSMKGEFSGQEFAKLSFIQPGYKRTLVKSRSFAAVPKRKEYRTRA